MKLDDNIKYLKGMGEFRAKQLMKVDIETVLDLMEYFPRTYIDRRTNVPIALIENNTTVALVGTIIDVYEKGYGRDKKKLHVVISDGTDSLMCIWFRYGKFVTSQMLVGKTVWVSGPVSLFMESYQIVHPDWEIIEGDTSDNDFWRKRPLLPVYKLTGTITNKIIRTAMVQCFSECATLIEENLPESILNLLKLPARKTALQVMHFATEEKKAEKARKRFSFEELFYTQLLTGRLKFRHDRIVQGLKFKLFHTYTSKLKESLPFELTKAQKRVINEIVQDMCSEKQMNRLIQGDVGSGKTIVTLFAMLIAIENGYQAIMMVPTEILAEQHYESISKYLKDQEEINVCILKGGSYKGKKGVKEGIANGDYQVIIGTHALIQDDIIFNKPGFMAVDEQHRFGVEQRAKLSQKMNFPDMLYLSATPIPRSLALTVYGDLEVSQIDQLPPTRKEVHTHWHAESKKPYVYGEIRKELQAGRQSYIVCPLVEESDKLDLLDAETLYQELTTAIFPDYRIALLHGKMKSAEKDEIMLQFKRHEHDILVSTTVIEVGVDVANASVMMIEHAERFGLSQLHQLRGRVGRGAEQAYCFLIAYPPISTEGRERLQTMISTSDGFVIAEKDLEIRGPGDFFGTEQSGLPNFKFANIIKDQQILNTARKIAFKILEDDPHLEDEKNRLIRDYYVKHYMWKEQLVRY